MPIEPSLRQMLEDLQIRHHSPPRFGCTCTRWPSSPDTSASHLTGLALTNSPLSTFPDQGQTGLAIQLHPGGVRAASCLYPHARPRYRDRKVSVKTRRAGAHPAQFNESYRKRSRRPNSATASSPASTPIELPRNPGDDRVRIRRHPGVDRQPMAAWSTSLVWRLDGQVGVNPEF
jgi:hypothetical protein